MTINGNTVAVRYPNFALENTGLAQCGLVLRVEPPAGWTYRIDQLTTRGWAHLSANTSAVVGTYNYFSDSLQTNRQTLDLAGPYNGEFGQIAYATSEGWSACNRAHTLTIASVLSAAGQGSASIGMWSTDATIGLRRC